MCVAPSSRRSGLAVEGRPALRRKTCSKRSGVERQQVFAVEFHGVLERAVQQPHVLKAEWLRLERCYGRRHYLFALSNPRGSGRRSGGLHDDIAAHREMCHPGQRESENQSR